MFLNVLITYILIDLIYLYIMKDKYNKLIYDVPKVILINIIN